nr:helix-turn-helix transcriptional regulator [uncultured Actinoplanes sp.]
MLQHRNTELGDFLRARRAALTPAETGVPTVASARRVPGLRREEVALLAGVSTNYYTRLEQGESHQMSDSVMEAIAGALRLDDTERLHLQRLARPSPPVRRDLGPEVVRDSLRSLVERNTDQIAYVVGRRMDVLAGNRLAYALYDMPPGQPFNVARQMFLEPATRDLFGDWPREARSMAAYLRVASASFPDDPGVAELVGELTIKSPAFVELWAAHPVEECANGPVGFRHPVAGCLRLIGEGLNVPGDSGQQVCFLSAADADTADRLRLLDSLTE